VTTARRDEFGYLFVVTYGRSGSTLLMGLLNSIPGYLIRGENWDALHHLFGFHRTLAEGSRRWEPARLRQRTHPFFGAGDFPVRKSLDGIRRLVLDTVLRPRDDTRVTGFKEIRWYGDDVVAYVAWLREVFPGARFVVNTRDHAEVRRSGWWAKRPENAEQLPAIEERILALAEGLGDAAYRVHYNDYVADPTVLRGLFDWLGEVYDQNRVESVLATPHSRRGKHRD
jgi:sulfotransferase family protein